MCQGQDRDPGVAIIDDAIIRAADRALIPMTTKTNITTISATTKQRVAPHLVEANRARLRIAGNISTTTAIPAPMPMATQ